MNTRSHAANLLGLFFAAVTLLPGQAVRGKDDTRTALLNQSSRNADVLLHDLEPMLKATGGVSRLYIYSTCSGDSQDLFFPKIELKAARDATRPLAALRDAFAKNKGVSISQREPGVTRISIGKVNDELLTARIHVLTLTPRQRYNFQDAIAAIINAREVQRKIRELRIEVSPRFVHYPILDSNPKLPHLPSSMNDVTMDEALDRVAESFGGLVIYEECSSRTGTRLFSVHMHEM